MVEYFIRCIKSITEPRCENKYPSYLMLRRSSFPIVFFIPGEIWDRAMMHTGSNNPVKFDWTVGVSSFTGAFHIPELFIKAIESNLNDPTFIKFQYYS